MAEIKVASVVAKVLKEEGVEWYAGVHGGHVWQLRPALERAFNSGKTSVINVIPDDTALLPQQASRIEYYKKLFAGKE